MNPEGYDLTVGDDCHVFNFLSEGPRGKIQKTVLFKPLEGVDNYYNLSFGDWDELTERVDDMVVSNNSDTWKVLNTVAQVVDLFLTNNPNAVIFASGSTPARNRLYQMNIVKYYSKIKTRFVVRGGRNKKWRSFKKGINFDAFLVLRKQTSLK